MNDMNKQTAVEWLYEGLCEIDKVAYDDIFEQAKQMEKEQIINAYQQAEMDNGKYWLHGDLYYNETYEKDKSES